VVPLFGGFVGVLVPPGISKIILKYRPWVRICFETLSWCGLFAGCLFLLFVRRSSDEQ